MNHFTRLQARALTRYGAADIRRGLRYLQLLAQGHSLAEIGRAYGLYHTAIYARVRQAAFVLTLMDKFDGQYRADLGTLYYDASQIRAHAGRVLAAVDAVLDVLDETETATA
jgi:DNA-binding CsgD family transcriptional regulator